MRLFVGPAVRLALRSHRRAPGTAATAMLTLGAGLTAAVVVLGFIDGATRPLPVPGGEDIAAVDVRDARARRVTSAPPVAEWALAPGVLGAGAVRDVDGALQHPVHAARRGYGAAMHASVLRLLGVQPALGRLPTDDAEDAGTLVLGWPLFEAFGADSSILGGTVRLDGEPHTVVGVMPEGFAFPSNHHFWTVLPERDGGEVVVRLAPGARREAVAAAMAAQFDAAARAAASDDATGMSPAAPHRVTLKDWTTSREEDAGENIILGGLGLLVLLLLLVCCANVATLLLVRGTERAGLLAVQRALGATRGRIAFQLLVESLVVAIGGGALGLGAGFLALRTMELRLSSHWGYYWMVMEVRPQVLLATLALVLASALVAGVVPALRASRVDIAGLLASQGRGTGDLRQRRLGRWFVGAQVALSTVGLIAAVFMAGYFRDIGASTERLPLDRVAVAEVRLAAGAYDDDGARAALLEALRAELGRLPGVTAVSVSAATPGPAPMVLIATPDMDETTPPRRVPLVAADARLAGVYDLRLVAGRSIEDAMVRDPVVLVSRGVAERYYGGVAVGERIRLEGVHGDTEWGVITGVFEDWLPDVRGTAAERVIVPLNQAWSRSLYVSLRTSDDAGMVLAGVRDAVRRVDERLPVEQLQTLRARMEWFNRMMKVIAGFGVFGGVASAVVAAVGLYGVMSFQIRIRRREIGIRMAVGAARGKILLETLRESVLRLVPGILLGAAAAVVVVPLIASRAPDADPASVALRMAVAAATAAALLVLIGVAATLEPAIRAARLDPQDVLRSGS